MTSRGATSESDLDLAISAALFGAAVGLEFFGRLTEVERSDKADGSPVTEADIAVERALRSVINTAHPNDSITGEETGTTGSSRRRWIIDGIDGTIAFVNNDPRWQTLIALEIDGVVEIGVAVVPAQGWIFYAQRDAGASCDTFDNGGLSGHSTRLAAGEKGDLDSARVAVFPPAEHLGDAERSFVGPLLHRTGPVNPKRHGALLVASGDLDLWIQLEGEEWDYAALKLIATEAGAAIGVHRPSTERTSEVCVFAATNQLLASALQSLFPNDRP